MPSDVKKISESRKAERYKIDPSGDNNRQVRALELIADQLEALRVEIVLLSTIVERLLRGSAFPPSK